MDLLLTTTSVSPRKVQSSGHDGQRASSSSEGPTDSRDGGQAAYVSTVRPTDSGDGGQGASASYAKPADFTSTVESAPFDALLGACVQGNAIPVKTVIQGEQLLSMLGGGDPAPHFQEAALEGTSREIASLPGGQRGAGNSWTGLLGTDAAPGWIDQASQEVEAGSPRNEGASPPRHRIVPESNSLNSDKVQDESAEGAFLSKEGGSSKGETQGAGLRATLSRMEALKGMEPPGEQQGGELKPAGHTGQGENAGSFTGKDGVSWKQEVQVDLPTRPVPPPVTSNQATPAHVAQAGSGGTFRVLGNDVHLRIQDEELGPMRWHIHLRGGRITAEAIVETSRVQELLQNHQDGLEAKLNAMGMDVEEFDVSVDEGSQRFAAFSDPDGSRQTRRATEDPPHDLSMEPVVSKLRGNQDRELDLYV